MGVGVDIVQPTEGHVGFEPHLSGMHEGFRRFEQDDHNTRLE